jgi:hypothetical protein
VIKLTSLKKERKNPRTIGGASLTLAVIAMIIAHKGGFLNINCVGDCLAETMTGEWHDD